jgi:predicted nucleotidyltransferase
MKQKDAVQTLDKHRQELTDQFGVQSLALFGSP